MSSGDRDAPRSAQRIAVLGLGEVGTVYGRALAEAGHVVTAYGPRVRVLPEGIAGASSVEECVASADIVMTLTPAAVSHEVAQAAATSIRPDAVYADFTTSSPAAKRALPEMFSGQPAVQIADVAILGPVVQKQTQTPLMAAGPGAPAIAALMESIGSPVEVLPGQPGEAMSHKLVRSVFTKGLASVVLEAVEAGRQADKEEWIRGQIAEMLSGDGQAVIDRFLTGTSKHAARRSAEMRAVCAYLSELGAPMEMSAASAGALQREADDGSASANPSV